MDKSKTANSSLLLARMQPFVELQRRRLKFAELGAQLEQFAPRIEPQQRYAVWVAAQQAYQSAGDPEGELRAFAAMPFGTGGRDQQASSISLLLSSASRQTAAASASNWNAPGQDAADFVVANGDAAQVHALGFVTALGDLGTSEINLNLAELMGVRQRAGSSRGSAGAWPRCAPGVRPSRTAWSRSRLRRASTRRPCRRPDRAPSSMITGVFDALFPELANDVEATGAWAA